MTTPETAASRWIFSKIASVVAPLRPASWQLLARRERAAAGRGAYATCALPGGLRVPRRFFSVLERRHARAFSWAVLPFCYPIGWNRCLGPGIEIAASARFELDDIRAAFTRRCEKVTLNQFACAPLSEPQFDLAND